MSSRFIFRWLGCVLLLGFTGCGLIDPTGTAIVKLKDPESSQPCVSPPSRN